jgi:tellurite methyltransferase
MAQTTPQSPADAAPCQPGPGRASACGGAGIPPAAAQTGDATSPTGAVGKKAQEYAAEKDWKGYFGAVLGKPPRDTLLAALDLFEKDAAKAAGGAIGGPAGGATGGAPGGAGVPPAAGSPGRAIDLGCGEGRDTLELLRRGWRVLAIDMMPEAFDLLLSRVPPDQRSRLETRIAAMERLDLEPGSCDLLNASYTIPFCEAGRFEAMWRTVTGAVRRGGRLAGQLFGDRDDWARCGDRCHFSRSQVDQLFAGFTWESFREEEHDEADSGGVKHWHVFHFVARKR